MQWNDWTFIDYVFVVIVLVSTAFAVRKGLAREAISLAALIGGFFLAAFLYPVAAGWFMRFLSTEPLAELFGFLLIFLGTLVIGAVAAFLVNRFIKMASLEWVDHLLGALFGFLRGCAVACIIALAMVAFPVSQNTLANSFFAPFLLTGARAAVLMVPQDLKDKFYEEYQKVQEAWNQNRNFV
jgi:membrane protein required for colicin V production